MNEYLIILVIAASIFGLLAAGLALREHRHPASRGQASGGGCMHANPKIKCLHCPSRADGDEGAGHS